MHILRSTAFSFPTELRSGGTTKVRVWYTGIIHEKTRFFRREACLKTMDKNDGLIKLEVRHSTHFPFAFITAWYASKIENDRGSPTRYEPMPDMQ